MDQPRPTTPTGTGGAKLMIVAVLLAVVAVLLTNFYIEMIRREVTEKGFKVYKLTKPLSRDTPLEKKHVEPVAVPKKFAASFRSLNTINEIDLKIYLAERAPLQRSAKEGELLTYEMFTSEGGRNLDQNIRKGKRWVSLPINSRTVPGALRPGMFVDIAGTFPTGGSLPETLPVMELVKVEALGTRVAVASENDTRRSAARRYQTLTIEVTPEEAAKLTEVQKLLEGEFDLLLRNPDDNERPNIPNGGVNPVLVDLVLRRQRMAAPAEGNQQGNWRRGN